MSATPSIPVTPPSSWDNGTVLLWIVLAFIVLLLVAIAVLLVWQLRRAAKKKKAEDKDSGAGEGSITAAEIPESFDDALQRLRARVVGRDFRYRLPWYLLIGPHGSGKRTLLSDSLMANLLDERVSVDNTHNLAWNFFADGIVIQAGGWCAEGTHVATSAWHRLLRLFVNHRPERPLDGIVLAISAKDLTGPNALSPQALAERAAILQQRLRQLSQRIGFRLPLYFVLTHCDAITGFVEFSAELEPQELEQIFGWSNPYGENLQFQSEWAAEAVNAMRVHVEQVQARLFTTNDYSGRRESMFLFPGALYSLIPSLQLLLTRILRGSGDIPAPMFRGLYCTGSAEFVRETVTAGNVMVPVARPAAPTQGFLDLFAVPDESLSWIPGPLMPWAGSSSLRIAFVHDLFVKKIFPEHGIGSPLHHVFQVRDRLRLSLQIASGATALLLALGTGFAYRRLHHEQVRLTPLLLSIESDLQAPPHFSAAANIDAHPGAEDLIHAMASFNSSGFHSLFMPTSWFAQEHVQIRDSMVAAFRMLVLQRFHEGLVQRSQELATLNTIPLPQAQLPPPSADLPPSVQLQHLPEYLQMQAFLQMVSNLDKNIAIYNRLSRRGDETPLASIVGLDEYLHHRSRYIPADETANPYFEQAVAEASWPPFDYSPAVEQQMTAKAQQLSAALYTAWISNNPTRAYTDKLSASILQLSLPGSHGLADLTTVQQRFRDAQQLYNSPDLRWTGADTDAFQMPAALAAVTTSAVSSSPFFQPWLRNWMTDVADQDFRTLADALDGASTPLTGPMIQINSGQLALSDRAQQLQLAVENLLNMPFMSAATGIFNPSLPGNLTHVVWDTATLQAAAQLPVVYQRYLTEDLDQAPAAIRSTLSGIAAAQVARAVEVEILEAQQPSLEAENAEQAAQNFSAAAPTLEQLLAALQQYNLSGPLAQLRQITVQQASALLLALDRELTQAAPYGVSASVFSSWTSGAPAEAIFDVSSADALAPYLAAQQDEIAALNTAAAPIVRFLESYQSALSTTAARALVRWKEIGFALQQSQEKQPGNSVSVLDKFIATGMDTITPASRCSTASTFVPSFKRPDYFLTAAQQLRQETVLRCNDLLHENFATFYRDLAARFNHDLAGQFPFAPLSAPSATESDPQLIASVYRIPAAAADLLRSSDASQAPSSVQSFLSQLTSSRPWFASILATTSAASLPGVDVLPQLRVNRQQEVGGDQIIDWSLTIGDQTMHRDDAPVKMHWSYGDPVTFSLRWARNAPFVPQKSSPAILNSAVPRSDQETVTWQFSDPWALLRFIQTFDATGTESRPQPFTLEFSIPETAASAASAKLQPQSVTVTHVFIRLQVFANGEKSPLASDLFPVTAPPLDSSAQTAHRDAEGGQE